MRSPLLPCRTCRSASALDLDQTGLEERLGLLVEPEVSERDGKALALRLQRAKLKPDTAADDRGNVWISEGQAMDNIKITGMLNTVLMMAGPTVTSLIVEAGNTVYLPFDSAITVTGTGASVKSHTGVGPDAFTERKS